MAVEKAGRPKIVSIESLRAKADAKAKTDARANATANARAEAKARPNAPRADSPAPPAPSESESPEIRNEKVLEVRRRLSEGFYDRPEVRLDTLRALLGEPREDDGRRPEGPPP